MSAKPVYGIDLGTTYSCIARVDDFGKPEMLPNAEGDLTTPSVVYFESSDNIVIGKTAKDEARFRPDQVKSMIKRSMGRKDAEFSYNGVSYKPPEISAYILRKLAQDAEQTTGEPVEDVVITCPAYFGVEQKEATKQAGEIAGLNVLYIIPEPTAAAIAYGMNQAEDQTILVYDLGGGTFDITLISVQAGAITVLSTDGDWELGGRDWDGLIVEYFADRFSEETGVPTDELLNDSETMETLLAQAEEAKRALSSKESVKTAVRHGADQARIELTRAKFDELTAARLKATVDFTGSMIEHARTKGFPPIDKLLLVGGSSYMPQVEDALTQFSIPIRMTDPNLIVAKGAAIFGYKYQLEEEIKIAIAEKTGQDLDDLDMTQVDDSIKQEAHNQVARDYGLPAPAMQALVAKTITNVTAKSFGVVVLDRRTNAERVLNLIQKDQSVPCDVTQTLATVEDHQDRVDLRCMENKIIAEEDETLDPATCVPLGEAVLDLGRPVPMEYPVEITFRLGPDGQLYVLGQDPQTGNQIDATFETDGIMSSEEVAAAKSRALTADLSS